MSDWSIQKLLNWICDYFTEKGVDSPRLSAELLLSEVLQMSRIDLYTNFDGIVSQDNLDKLHKLVKRCSEHEPLAYLIGRTEFYSLDIRVSGDCLMPRPETELLVEKAIEFLQLRDGEQFVCDLCTGSGCVAVAIAKNFLESQLVATDICDAALSIAAKNVENHEPRKALYAGADGLDVYMRLIEQVDNFLKPDGVLMLEIGYDQADPVGTLLEKTGSFAEIKIETDYADNDRIAIAKKQD